MMWVHKTYQKSNKVGRENRRVYCKCCGKEGGLMKVININQYTVDGRKDAFGVFQLHTSLKYLMGNCKEFEEEESLLQLRGEKWEFL
jgi:hypothetical protein